MNEFSDTGFTALHVACDRDMVDMANYLVLKGASLEAKDAKGRTPVDVCGSIGLDEFADWEKKTSSKSVESLISPDHENVSALRYSINASEDDYDLLKLPPNEINPMVEKNVYTIKTSRRDLMPIDCSEAARETIASPSELSVHQKIKDLNMRIGHQPMPPNLLSAIRAPGRRASTPNRYRQQYEATCNEHERTVRSRWSTISVGPLPVKDEESRAPPVSSGDFKRNKNSFRKWERVSDTNDGVSTTFNRRGTLIDSRADSLESIEEDISAPGLSLKSIEEDRDNSVILPEDFFEGESVDNMLGGVNPSPSVRCSGGSPLTPFTPPAVSPQDPAAKISDIYPTATAATTDLGSDVIKLDALEVSGSPGVSLSPVGMRRHIGKMKMNDTNRSPVGSPDAAAAESIRPRGASILTESSDCTETFITQTTSRSHRLVYSEERNSSDDFFGEYSSEELDNASSEVKTSTTASNSTVTVKDLSGFRSRSLSDSHFSDRLSNVSNASTVQIGFSSSFVSSTSADQEDSTVKYTAYSPEAFRMNPSDRIPPTIPAAIRRLSVDCGESDSVSQWLLRGEAAMHSPRDSFQEALARHELLAAGSPIHDRGSGIKHMPSQFAMSKDKKPKTLSYILNNSYGSNMGSDSDGESISSGWSWSAAKGRESIEVQTEAVHGLKRSETTCSEDIDNAADVAAEKVNPYITSRRGSKVLDVSSDEFHEDHQQGEEEVKNLLQPKLFEEEDERHQQVGDAEELDVYDPDLVGDQMSMQQEEGEGEGEVLEESDTSFEPFIVKVPLHKQQRELTPKLKQEVEELDAHEPYSEDQMSSQQSPMVEEDEEKVEDEAVMSVTGTQSVKVPSLPQQVDEVVGEDTSEPTPVDKELMKTPIVHLHTFKGSVHQKDQETKVKFSFQASIVEDPQQQQQQQSNEGVTIKPFAVKVQHENGIKDDVDFLSAIESTDNEHQQDLQKFTANLPRGADGSTTPGASVTEESESHPLQSHANRVSTSIPSLPPMRTEKEGPTIKAHDTPSVILAETEGTVGGDKEEKSSASSSFEEQEGDVGRDELRAMQERIFILETKLAESQHTELLATVAAVASATQLDNETKKHRDSMRILNASMRIQLTDKEDEVTTLNNQLKLAKSVLSQAGDKAKLSTQSHNDLEHRAMLALEKLESQLRTEAVARQAAEERSRVLELELNRRITSPKAKGNKKLTSPLRKSGDTRAGQQDAASALQSLSVTPASLASLLIIYKKLGEVLQEQSAETLALIEGSGSSDHKSVQDVHLNEVGKSSSQKSDADVLVTFDVIYPVLKGHGQNDLNRPVLCCSPDLVKGGSDAGWEDTTSCGTKSSARSSSASLIPANLSGSRDALEGRKGQINYDESSRVITPDHESRSFTASPSLENILFVEDNPFVNSPKLISNVKRREGFDKSISSLKKGEKSPVSTGRDTSPQSVPVPSVSSPSPSPPPSYVENPLLMAVERHLVERKSQGEASQRSPSVKPGFQNLGASNYVMDFINTIEHEQRQGDKLDVLLELNDIPDFDENNNFFVEESMTLRNKKEQEKGYSAGDAISRNIDSLLIQKISNYDQRELFVEPIDFQIASSGLTLIGRRSHGKRSEYVHVPVSSIQQEDVFYNDINVDENEKKNLIQAMDAELCRLEITNKSLQDISGLDMYVSPTTKWEDEFKFNPSSNASPCYSNCVMRKYEGILQNINGVNQDNNNDNGFESNGRFQSVATDDQQSQIKINNPSPRIKGQRSPLNPFSPRSTPEKIQLNGTNVRTSPGDIDIFESAFHTPGKKRNRAKDEALFSISDTFSGYSLLSHSLDDIPFPLGDSSEGDTSTNSYPEVHSDIWEQEQEQEQEQEESRRRQDKHDEIHSVEVVSPQRDRTTVISYDSNDLFLDGDDADSDEFINALASPRSMEPRHVESLGSILPAPYIDKIHASELEFALNGFSTPSKALKGTVSYMEDEEEIPDQQGEKQEGGDRRGEGEGEGEEELEESWSGYSSQAERMVMLKLDWALATLCSTLHTLQDRIRHDECCSPHQQSLLQLAAKDKKSEAFRRLKQHIMTPHDLLALGSNPLAVANMMKSNEPALWAIFLRYGPLGANKFTNRFGDEVRRQPSRKCRRLSVTCTIDLFSDFELCADVKS